MKKFAFKALLLSGVLFQAAVANAADYLPPPPVDDLRPASYDWSGLYVGGWVGNACLDGQLDDGALQYNLSGCGFKGGLGAGYNYQIQDWVIGAEVDYGWGTRIVENYDIGAVGDNLALSGIGTARAKLGYAFDDTLIFITAGGTYASFKLTGQAGATSFSTKDDMLGWTIGGGIEHALTDQFRIRLDYLYTDFGNNDFGCIPGCNIDVDSTEHEVRLGAFWAFNWF
jgi:outer membrane immunogenic protein